MKEILTSEEVFRNAFNTNLCHIDYDKAGLDTIKQAMIEFTKLHVKAALKEASEQALIKQKFEHLDTPEYSIFFKQNEYSYSIDKNSILNTYPLTNIK